MHASLELPNKKTNKDSIFLCLMIFFMAILMHQSNVIFGVNISFADLFSMVILLVLIYYKRLLIPVTPMLFFLVVSAVVLMTATVYVPFYFELFPSPVKVISEYIKLLAIIIYFLIGYNLTHLQAIDKTIKWYSVFGIAIAVIGIVFTILNVKLFSSILFYADIRYRGLMIDPNYYSVLLVSALVYFTRVNTIKLKWKYFFYLLVFIAVMTSGSKTGLITLLGYSFLRLIEAIYSRKKKVRLVTFYLILAALLIMIAPHSIELLQSWMNDLAINSPSLARVLLLFTDFNSAIAGNGSERDTTWNVAIQIIEQTPLIGTGIGTYTLIANELYQYNNVAHNTFLQITAEWGIPLATVFFSYLFYCLGKVTMDVRLQSKTNVIIRDIIIILLIGSMAITLSNARMLWLFFGAFVFSINKVNETNKKL